MFKKLRYAIFSVLVMVTGLLCGCDPGIYDLGVVGETNNPFSGMDMREFLDPKPCYGQLLKDLEFMKSDCYSNEQLAGAQAYTIMMSYGLADMAKEAATFTAAQLAVKADLFDAIKQINLYSNNFTDNIINLYNPGSVLTYTERAITLCKQMQTYF